MSSCFVYGQLQTTDPGRAKDFYSRVFAWNMKDDPPGQGPPYTEVFVEEDDIAGIMPLPPSTAGSRWVPYISVDDVDVVVAKAAEEGATIAMPAMDIPAKGVRVCVLVDPTGAVFAVRNSLGKT